MDLLLKDLRWHDGIKECSGDIRISKGLFNEIGHNLDTKKGEFVCHFKNHFVYPGLINAHDHLEMNLYPKLGKPPYANYVEWANDIYKPDQSPIKEIEKISIKDRLLWGGIKNLISGVTTVVHHNPWHRFLGKEKFPVRVLKKIAWAHSIKLGKKIQREFPRNSDVPFIIHAAEGIDPSSFEEIQKLNDLGLVKKNTVLIHAIALTEKDIELLSQGPSSVVWCPASNDYMFHQTAAIDKLKRNMRVALGSDSTLTGSPTLLEEMQVAFKTGYANSKEISAMVTTIPANIFNLQSPSITLLNRADFFIVPHKYEDYFENLVNTQPRDIELVVVNGNPRLAAANYDWKSLTNSIKVQGMLKHTDVEVASLKRRIEKKINPSVLESNPLWKLIDA